MNPTVKSLILTDWAPHIEKTVRLIAVPIAAVYVAGYMAGQWLHQLNDALTTLATARPQPPAPIAQPVIVQRCAVAPVVARCGIQAPDPMARAIAAVKDGSTQAAAARRYGVSRSTLRRRLSK
jgi:hypothetical protein